MLASFWSGGILVPSLSEQVGTVFLRSFGRSYLQSLKDSTILFRLVLCQVAFFTFIE